MLSPTDDKALMVLPVRELRKRQILKEPKALIASLPLIIPMIEDELIPLCEDFVQGFIEGRFHI